MQYMNPDLKSHYKKNWNNQSNLNLLESWWYGGSDKDMVLIYFERVLLFRGKYRNIYRWNYGVWDLLQSNPVGFVVINETKLAVSW